MLMSLQCSQNRSNQLLLIQYYQPPLQFISKLQDITKSNKAIKFYFKNLLNKTFLAIKQLDRQNQINLLQLGLFAFKKQLLTKRRWVKSQKNLIQLLKHNYFQMQNKKLKQKKAGQFYQLKMLKKYFEQFKISLINIKKLRTLILYLKTQNFQQFSNIVINSKKRNLRNQQDKKQLNQIVYQFYSKNILKTYFKLLHLFTMNAKIQKQIKKNKLRRLFRQIKYLKQIKDKSILNFIRKKQQNIKRGIFQIIKNLKIEEEHQLRLQLLFKKAFLRKLKSHFEILKSKKQIQKANEFIISQYLQQKNKTLQFKYFKRWTNKIKSLKQFKKQTKMVKQYAQIKQKQILLKAYFEKLILNVKYTKAQKFYNKRMKIKCFQSLKFSIIKQSQKLQKVLDFIKNRQLGRYFKALKAFNLQTQYKINRYLLSKNWNNFTNSIITHYIFKYDKASTFNRNYLLKKAFKSLQKQMQINKNAAFCAAYINLIRPIRNWRKLNKIQHFIKNKDNLILKRLFFQFKVLTIRHQISKEEEFFQIKKSCQQYPFHSSQFKSMIQSKITTKNVMETSFFNCSMENSQRLQTIQKQSQDQDYIDRKVDELMTKLKTKIKHETLEV